MHSDRCRHGNKLLQGKQPGADMGHYRNDQFNCTELTELSPAKLHRLGIVSNRINSIRLETLTRSVSLSLSLCLSRLRSLFRAKKIVLGFLPRTPNSSPSSGTDLRGRKRFVLMLFVGIAFTLHSSSRLLCRSGLQRVVPG